MKKISVRQILLKSLDQAILDKYGMPNDAWQTIGRKLLKSRKGSILGGYTCFGSDSKRVYVTWKREGRASVIVGSNFSFDAAIKRCRKTFKGISGQLDRAVDFVNRD